MKMRPMLSEGVNEPLVRKGEYHFDTTTTYKKWLRLFVKALKYDKPTFLYLKKKFSKISDAKVKEGIFVGPQLS